MSYDPPFQSRGSQIAAHLRAELEAGQWRERLPSERQLALRLRVARRTVRAALKELEAEGWFRERGRSGTKIAPKRRLKPAVKRSVGFLFHNRHPEVKLVRHPLVIQVREYLEHLDIRLEVHRVKCLQSAQPSAAFHALMLREKHDLWLLAAQPPAVEEWFFERQIPAVVYGMGDIATPLPTYSIDFQAIGRHAAAEFLRRGYRDIVLFLPRPTNSEDAHTRLGFEELVQAQPSGEVRYRLIWHQEDRDSLMRVVNRLLLNRERPMAWFIMRPEFYFFIHTYLLHLGVRIPDDVGLICRNITSYLRDLFPEPARYETDSHQLGHSFARYVLRTLEGQSPGSLRLMADFLPGETLRRPLSD